VPAANKLKRTHASGAHQRPTGDQADFSGTGDETEEVDAAAAAAFAAYPYLYLNSFAVRGSCEKNHEEN